jgi:hypothetical protein
LLDVGTFDGLKIKEEAEEAFQGRLGIYSQVLESKEVHRAILSHVIHDSIMELFEGVDHALV